jgi:hypothetical protein
LGARGRPSIESPKRLPGPLKEYEVLQVYAVQTGKDKGATGMLRHLHRPLSLQRNQVCLTPLNFHTGLGDLLLDMVEEQRQFLKRGIEASA